MDHSAQWLVRTSVSSGTVRDVRLLKEKARRGRMAKLYDEARKLLSSGESLAALRAQPGIPDDEAVQSAVDYGLPVLITALDRRVAESHGTVELVEMFRSLDYSELRTPFMWNSTSARAVTGGSYLRAAFAVSGSGSDHRYACRKLAEWTLVSPPAAERILQDVAWVYCAVLAQSQADRMDLQTLRAALTEDRRTLRRQGSDVWVNEALSQSPVSAGSSHEDSNRSQEQEELAPLQEIDFESITGADVDTGTTTYTNTGFTTDVRPRRAVAMASSSGPGRYPPPIRRDQRTPTDPGRPGSVPPPRRPGQGERTTRSVPAPRGRERDQMGDAGGGFYDGGQGGGRGLVDSDPYEDMRQPPTRHRPISQPLGDNRHEPPFEPPRSSRNPLPLIMGALALLLAGAVAFWVYSNVLTGDDADTSEVTAADEAVSGDAAAGTAEDSAATDESAVDAEQATSDDEVATEVPTEAGPNDRIELTVPMNDIFTGNATATGSIGMTMDRITGEICFGIETSGIEPPYPAHIHRGASGVKGPIAVDFTPQSDVGLSCTNVPPKNVQEILSNPEGYYAEMHDSVEKTLTIRGQISEATVTSDPGGIFGAAPLLATTGPPTDPNGGGALIAIESGTIVLRGEVADEAAAQQVRDQIAGLGPDVPVNDELVINPSAPLPSGIFEVGDGIEFDTGSADLSPSTGSVLDLMAALISAHPEWSLYITGHTDDVGGDVPNLDLSLRRASTVRDALVSRGVAEGQLGVLGAGSRLPKVANDTEENRAKNRRIEFEIDAG